MAASISLQQAARTALDVQNAANLSAVVDSFNDIFEALWPEARKLGRGTDYVNRHPIVTLFLHRLASLNHSECFCSECITNYSRAHAEVQRIASGEVRP